MQEQEHHQMILLYKWQIWVNFIILCWMAGLIFLSNIPILIIRILIIDFLAVFGRKENVAHRYRNEEFQRGLISGKFAG
jgi:hypothetical protein